MSGGKFSLPMIAAGLLVEMLAAQGAAGIAAGEMRGAAETEERTRRAEGTRTRFLEELAQAHRQIVEPDALHPAHLTHLLHQHEQIAAAVVNARTEREIWAAVENLPHLQADVKSARMNKRFHDMGETRKSDGRLHQRLEALESEVNESEASDSVAESATNAENLLAAVSVARAAVNGRASDAEEKLNAAAAAFEAFRRREAERRVETRRGNAEREHNVTEYYALVAGLKMDPFVTRWRSTQIDELDKAAAEIARPGVTAEQAAAYLETARAKAKLMIEQANEAQFRADQRDYITNSIAQSLMEMGFVVGGPEDEYPGHPSTAKVLQAASSSGKAIFVSVPVEGQVWYEVDGYTKTTSAGLGGDLTLACDEGERVLNEMHARLESEFKVEMSEIWWEGKDPNRGLRRADALPAADEAARGGRR